MGVANGTKYTLDCGCERTIGIGTTELCSKHAGRIKAEADVEAAFGPPKCPDCKSDARRPKCFFELGQECPRHVVLDTWNDIRLALEKYQRALSEFK